MKTKFLLMCKCVTHEKTSDRTNAFSLLGTNNIGRKLKSVHFTILCSIIVYNIVYERNQLRLRK